MVFITDSSDLTVDDWYYDEDDKPEEDIFEVIDDYEVDLLCIKLDNANKVSNIFGKILPIVSEHIEYLYSENLDKREVEKRITDWLNSIGDF